MSRSLRDRFRRRRASIGVDRTRLAWSTDGAARECELKNLPDRLDSLAGADALVIVDPAVATHWVQAPPRNLRSLGELKRVAQARCAHLFGGEPGDWQVAGDWSIERPFACAALPLEFTKPLATMLERSGCTYRWQTLWGLVVQHRAGDFAADAWNALVTSDRATVWRCHAGEVVSLSAFPTADTGNAQAALHAVREHISIEAARGDASPSADLYWCDTLQRELPPTERLHRVSLSGAREHTGLRNAQLAMKLSLELGAAR